MSLTPGDDTVVAPASGATVLATAATLNAGDSLTGGVGTDVLKLIGSGTFRVDQLASFTGFEKITVNNATNSFANLTLGSQPIEVDAAGNLNIQVCHPRTGTPAISLMAKACRAYLQQPIGADHYIPLIDDALETHSQIAQRLTGDYPVYWDGLLGGAW